MRRTLVLSAFFTGYVLGYFNGYPAGRIAGARETMLNMIGGFAEGMRDRD